MKRKKMFCHKTSKTMIAMFSTAIGAAGKQPRSSTA